MGILSLFLLNVTPPALLMKFCYERYFRCTLAVDPALIKLFTVQWISVEIIHITLPVGMQTEHFCSLIAHDVDVASNLAIYIYIYIYEVSVVSLVLYSH